MEEVTFTDCPFTFSCPPQWVKTPLLASRHRGVYEKSSMDTWKFRLTTRLPAHLCACALLGRVARSVAFIPPDQKEVECPSHLPNLKHTGTKSHRTFVCNFVFIY